MNIALDFDGTYTEDTALWNRFIMDARKRNHKVFCITFRKPEHERLNQADFAYLRQMGVQCIFTDRVPKRKFVEIMGLRIDIWIDDNPDLIIKESEWSKEDYDVWSKAEAKRVLEVEKDEKKAKKDTKVKTKRLYTATGFGEHIYLDDYAEVMGVGAPAQMAEEIDNGI